MYNRQSENINNPSLLYLAVSFERGFIFKINIMKISELPEKVKAKALEYQRNELNNSNKNNYKYNQNTDCLTIAFNWNNTKEGFEYWMDWDSKKSENQKFEYDSNGVTKPEQYQIGIDTFQRAEANLSKDEILSLIHI